VSGTPAEEPIVGRDPATERRTNFFTKAAEVHFAQSAAAHQTAAVSEGLAEQRKPPTNI